MATAADIRTDVRNASQSLPRDARSDPVDLADPWPERGGCSGTEPPEVDYNNPAIAELKSRRSFGSFSMIVVRPRHDRSASSRLPPADSLAPRSGAGKAAVIRVKWSSGLEGGRRENPGVRVEPASPSS